jgi:hypothetical protein
MTELLSLTNDSEVLFRQVHPDLMDGEVPASSGFLPTPGDNDELSVDRSSITTAGAAFSLYTSGGRRSAAVFGVTVGESAPREFLAVKTPYRNLLQRQRTPPMRSRTTNNMVVISRRKLQSG